MHFYPRYRSLGFDRRAMSLIEVVVSMGLLAAIMIPIFGLMATSQKILNAGEANRAGAYARQTALDAVIVRMRSAQQVLATGSQHVDILTASGAPARLSFSAGQLRWSQAGAQQVLVNGLTNARFSFGTAPGADASAGSLLLVEVATQAPAEPNAHWSSTTIWIKPTS